MSQLIEQVKNQDENWVIPEYAAEVIRVSKKTLAKWRCQKTHADKLRTSKRGKLVRYWKPDVDSFFDEKEES